MKNKLILGIGIGIAATVVLVLALVGLVALVGSDSESEQVGQFPTGAPPTTMNGVQPITSAAPTTQAQVVINGRALTAQQIQAMEQVYRTRPQPGNYWYDSKSGLFGVVGQAAAGFMYPGHDLGPLAANASGGDTGVFFNGREQTAQELQVLSSLARTQIPPGRYWLDGQGNAGYEGNPKPVAPICRRARRATGRPGSATSPRGHASAAVWRSGRRRILRRKRRNRRRWRGR